MWESEVFSYRAAWAGTPGCEMPDYQRAPNDVLIDIAQNWGWACENIVALDVVTPDGEQIRVDAEQNSDLLWAAKGAGPGKY